MPRLVVPRDTTKGKFASKTIVSPRTTTKTGL